MLLLSINSKYVQLTMGNVPLQNTICRNYVSAAIKHLCTVNMWQWLQCPLPDEGLWSSTTDSDDSAGCFGCILVGGLVGPTCQL